MNCFDLDDSMNLGAMGPAASFSEWRGDVLYRFDAYGNQISPAPVPVFVKNPLVAPAPDSLIQPIPTGSNPYANQRGQLPSDFYTRNEVRPDAPAPIVQTPQELETYSVKSDIVTKSGGADGKESLAAVAQSATPPVGAGVILAILGALIFRG